MNQIKVSYKRHLAKTISYRIISTLVGFVGMWWATGNVKFGFAFGIAELIYKPIQYYIHERVWYRFIKFGLVEEKKKKTGLNMIENKAKTNLKESPESFLEKSPTLKPKKGKRLSYSKKTV